MKQRYHVAAVCKSAVGQIGSSGGGTQSLIKMVVYSQRPWDPQLWFQSICNVWCVASTIASSFLILPTLPTCALSWTGLKPCYLPGIAFHVGKCPNYLTSFPIYLVLTGCLQSNMFQRFKSEVRSHDFLVMLVTQWVWATKLPSCGENKTHKLGPLVNLCTHFFIATSDNFMLQVVPTILLLDLVLWSCSFALISHTMVCL